MMSTLLVACCFTNLAAAASLEINSTDAGVEWWPVLSLSTALLLLVVVATCVTSRRERADSLKAPVGTDLVERGVLHGERSGGPCERLSRCWLWAPRPPRSPILGRLRKGLQLSTHPLLHYQLLEKRHVQDVRGALCVIRADLKELQDLAEQESTPRTSRGSRGSDDIYHRISMSSWRGSLGGSPTGGSVSVSETPVAQTGTVTPVESSGKPQRGAVESGDPGVQRVSWSESAEDIMSGTRVLREERTTEHHSHDQISNTDFTVDVKSIEKRDIVGETASPTKTVDTVEGSDSQQTIIVVSAKRDLREEPTAEHHSHDQISNTDFTIDIRSIEKQDIVGETASPTETVDTKEGSDSQQPITVVEEITQGSYHVTPFKKVVKARSYLDIYGKAGQKPKQTASIESTRARRKVLPHRKVRSATDAEQSSESDVLVEISGSNEEFHTYRPSSKLSQGHDSVLMDNMVLEKRSAFTLTGDPVSSRLQEEEHPATFDSVTTSPSVYMSVLDHDAPNLPRDTTYMENREMRDASTCISSCFLHDVSPLSQQESPLSQKEVPHATFDTTQSPEVFMSVLDHDAPNFPREIIYKEKRQVRDASTLVSSCFLHNVVPLSQQPSALSEKEVPRATFDTTQSPDVYMSVLDHDAPNFPKEIIHKGKKDEGPDIDGSRCISSCFLHDVAPHLNQESSQSNTYRNSKSVRYSSLPPEEMHSVQHPRYRQHTEYKVAPAAVMTTNKTFFSSSKKFTEGQNVKYTGVNVAGEDTPGLQTSWDLLHSFPSRNNTVQMLTVDTRSKLSPASKSHRGFKQPNELSVYLSCKGDGVLPVKQQESLNMQGVTPDSRHKRSSAVKLMSTAAFKPPSSRHERSLIPDTKTVTQEQHQPLSTLTNAGGDQKVLHWRITITPHLVDISDGHNTVSD